MLPGFRFLFAAIILSISILVFGLGAAALLRTAHEEFASTPALYAPPETRFAQATDATGPVLELLRVDDAPNDTIKETLKDPDKDISRTELPASNVAPTMTPTEPAVDTAPPEAAKSEPSNPQAAKTDPVAAVNVPPPDAAPARADAPAAANDTKGATAEPTAPSVNEPAPTISAAPVTAETTTRPNPADIASSVPGAPAITTRIATLGGPPVDSPKQPSVKPASGKAASAKPDTDTAKKHKRRRLAARARLAGQPQQPADPFAPLPTVTQR